MAPSRTGSKSSIPEKTLNPEQQEASRLQEQAYLSAVCVALCQLDATKDAKRRRSEIETFVQLQVLAKSRRLNTKQLPLDKGGKFFYIMLALPCAMPSAHMFF